jgi:tetratricopeptide (TPR) repeat protein
MKKKSNSGICREILGKWKKLKFPRNYRVITAIIISLFLISLITLISLKFYRNWQEKQRLEAERAKISQEVEYWQGITSKYHNYRDAYFELSMLEYKLNNLEKSRNYLQKALEIDPNFGIGKRFEKLLEIQDRN